MPSTSTSTVGVQATDALTQLSAYTGTYLTTATPTGQAPFVPSDGYGAVILELVEANVGSVTIALEGTYDNPPTTTSNWYSLTWARQDNAASPTPSQAAVSLAQNGKQVLEILSDYAFMRVRPTTNNGSLTARWYLIPVGGGSAVGSGGGSGGTVTANQGAAAALASAWPVEITDATNGPAAVKAASTAAAAADPALVVSLSPNSPASTKYTNGATVSGSITSAAVVATATVTGYTGALITYNGTGYTGTANTIVFEASDDAGTTWYPAIANRLDISAYQSTVASLIAQLQMYQMAAPGATTVRVRCSVFGSTSGTQPVVRITPTSAIIDPVPGVMLANAGGTVALINAATDAMSTAQIGLQTTSFSLGYNGASWDRLRTAAGTTGILSVNTEGTKTTYSGSVTGLAAVNGDVFTITGTASKTVRVTRVQLSGAATAAADVDIVLIKRSAADTGGTSAAVTAVPHDSSNAAATATVLSYTVAPTPGAAVGTMFARKITVPSLTSPAVSAAPNQWEFTTRNEQAVVLRGVAQVLAVNIASVPTGGAFDIDVTWTEE